MKAAAIALSFLLITACATTPTSGLPAYAGKWIDTETNSIIEITVKNNIPTVISVIDYDNIQDRSGREEYKVVKSTYINGTLEWSYFVPSTGYTVNLHGVSLNGNQFLTKWDNSDPDGTVLSGEEILYRADKNLDPIDAPADNDEENSNDESGDY